MEDLKKERNSSVKKKERKKKERKNRDYNNGNMGERNDKILMEKKKYVWKERKKERKKSH